MSVRGMNEKYVEGSGTALTAIKYYHADRLSSVAALTDSAGKVTDRYAYDPYGNETSGAPVSGQLFRYTGRKFEPESGLYYYRARYYDPEMGRFLQTDPVGYADQFNLYTYVANDPLNATDPSGKYCSALNMGSVFCRRSQLFADIDTHTRSQTTFFAAASMTTEALGALDGPGASLFTSPSTRQLTRQLSADLENINIAIADTLIHGHGGNQFSGSKAQIDRQIVRLEQGVVQSFLDDLKQTDPSSYGKLVSETNANLNGIQARYEGIYSGILDGVREELGTDIDFANQDHRIAIGDALTSAIRSNSKVTCTGSRIKRDSC